MIITKRVINWLLATGAILIVSIMIIIGKIPFGTCPDKFFVQMGTFSKCLPWSAANDISGDGLRVVGQSVANCIPDHKHPVEAAGWTRNCIWGEPFYAGGKKGMIELGYLPSAAQSSLPYGISPDGLVAVGYSDVALYVSHAVVFLQTGIIELAKVDGTAKDVSLPNSYLNNNWGNGLMNNRIVVGWKGSNNHPHKTSGIGDSAVYWKSFSSVVMLELPSILSNGHAVVSSEAICISNDGETIGGNLYYNMQAEKDIFRSYPCVWKWNGNKYELKVLQDLAGGDTNARITHISGDGRVLVGWGNTIAGDSTCDGYPIFACKWTSYPEGSAAGWNVVPTKLNPLPGALKYSYAAGTNLNGTVIVGSTFDYGVCPDVAFDSKATLWEGGLIKDLETELHPKVPKGYSLKHALRVSDNGKIIIGTSYPPGFESEGWIGGRH